MPNNDEIRYRKKAGPGAWIDVDTSGVPGIPVNLTGLGAEPYEFDMRNGGALIEITPLAVVVPDITLTTNPTNAGIGSITGADTPTTVAARMTATGVTNPASGVTTTIEALVNASVVGGSTTFRGGDAVTIRLTYSRAGYNDAVFSLAPITVVAVASPFTLSNTADGEMEMDGVTGSITVTITSPAEYAGYDAGNGAGVFIFDSADLATGPVNLVPPQIIDDGTPASGKTLTITPGLWVYNPDNGALGSPTFQWQSDTAGSGSFADIGGATSSSYVLTAAEDGDDVRVRATLADNGGSRMVASSAIGIAGTAAPGFSDSFNSDTRASYTPSAGWEIVGGEARVIGAAGNFLTIRPVVQPSFAGDHYVEGTLGALGTGANQLRLYGKIDQNWGVTYYSVRLQILPSGAVTLVKVGTGGEVFMGTVNRTIAAGHTFSLRFTNNQDTVTVLHNNVEIGGAFTNANVSDVPDSSRIGFGLQNNSRLAQLQAGDL